MAKALLAGCHSRQPVPEHASIQWRSPSRLAAVAAHSLPTTWPVFVFGRSRFVRAAFERGVGTSPWMFVMIGDTATPVSTEKKMFSPFRNFESGWYQWVMPKAHKN